MLAFVKKTGAPGGDFEEWPEPSIKTQNQVIIEVNSCGICGTDVHFYEWPREMHNQLTKIISFPRVLGHEVAGILKEVGRDVTNFKVGDRVVCETWGGCGICYYCRLGRFNHCLYKRDNTIGQKVDGGMAKYMVAPSLSLYKIPETVSFDEAAVIEPLGVALHALERSNMKPGDDMAVIGPGPIGLLGVMVGQVMGAAKVFILGLEVDRDRLKVGTSLGGQAIIADQQGFVEQILHATHGMGVDVVLDTSGGQNSIHTALKVLKQCGEILQVGIGAPFLFDSAQLVRKEVSLVGSYRRLPSSWIRAINLVGTKRVDVSKVITHCMPLHRAKEGFDILLKKRGLKVILNP